MPFHILPLDPARFAALHALADDDLLHHRARRINVTDHPGFPCRVSLADAAIGESVLLVHHVHQPAETPFHAGHAVYVRPGVRPWQGPPGSVPEMLRSRMLSLRGFAADGMLIAADLADGRAVEAALVALLADRDVAEVHIHFAGPGCYAARAVVM